MRKISIYLMLMFIFSACASLAPSAVPMSVVVVSETPISIATKTKTPIPAATAIPATPEYESTLSYDPEAHTLNNPQGTPVFIFSEDGEWEMVIPEVLEEIRGLNKLLKYQVGFLRR